MDVSVESKSWETSSIMTLATAWVVPAKPGKKKQGSFGQDLTNLSGLGRRISVASRHGWLHESLWRR